MKKKVLAFLLASTMVIEPFSVAGAADFSDGTGQEAEVQFSDDAEDVPEVDSEIDGVDQFSADVAGEGESSSKPSEDAIQMGDDVWFTFDDSTSTATISGTGDMWDYYENGYDYTNKHKNPFIERNVISKIVIEDGITSVSDLLLWEYNNIYTIKEILLGKGIKRIGKCAFYNCFNVKSIILPSELEEIDKSAFWNCNGLENIVIPEKVEKLNASCFAECSSLKSVVLSSSLKSIGSSAFNGCINLMDITLPSGIENIGSYAFGGCTSISKITLPKTLKTLDDDIFDRCTNLTDISFEEGFSCNISNRMFENCTGLTKIVIPEMVSSIGNYAFGGCTRLATAIIKGNTTQIGFSIFENCPNLRVIQGHDCSYIKQYYNSLSSEQQKQIKFESLGEGSHQFTAQKVQIKEPTCTEKGIKAYRCEICGTTTEEEEVPAYGHNWDEGIIIKPATETEEGKIKYTCRRCGGEKTESIPKLSTIVINNTNYYWVTREDLRISANVNKESSYYIMYVKKGQERPQFDPLHDMQTTDRKYLNTVVSLPDEEVDIYLFIMDDTGDNTYLKLTPNYSYRPSNSSFQVGRNVTAAVERDTLILSGTGETYDGIDWQETSENYIKQSNIKHIVVNNGITSLGWGFFEGFGNVKDVELPSTLQKIRGYAFIDCGSIENITIPESVTVIEEGAFTNCTSIEKIVLPSKLTDLGYTVFTNCNAEIVFPAGLKYIPCLGNNAAKKVEIPEGIEVIQEDAFHNCTLEDITIPSTIKVIEGGAFSNTDITTFNWPENIDYISNYALAYTKLKEFSVPETVTEINDSAFCGCSDLTKISIPKTVTYIGADVFKYCKNLTIYGYKDSAAESYAKANNIKFVSADYKVIFKDNGRTQKTEYVIKGQNATPPTLPAKEGYTLSWDADYTNITEDMVINAVWTKKDSGGNGGGTTIIVSPSETTKYTVTFKDRGEVVKTEKVKSGEAAEYPFITRSGYKLSWDKDFSKITADTTVNAVWTVIKPEKVTSLTAEAGKKSIALSWDRTENADYYLVFRKAASETEYKQIKKTTKILWTDTSAVPGTEYSYKVVGVCSLEGKKYQGTDSDVVTTKIGTPQIGDTYSVGNLNYKITAAKEVSVTGLAKVTDTLTIPSSVTISGKVYKVIAIQDKVFYRNEDIVKVTIGNNVTNVGKYAFYQCSSLETVKFGKRVAVINTCAFTQCPNLENVTLPSSIRKIGAKAFYQCTSIKTLKINGSVLEYVGKKGLAVNKSVTLKLPKKSYSAYQKLIKASSVYAKTKFVKF